MTLVVLDLPRYARASMDFDGGMGWYSLSQNVLRIDSISREITFLPKCHRRHFIGLGLR